MIMIYVFSLAVAIILSLLLGWWAVVLFCALGVMWWLFAMYMERQNASGYALGCGFLMVVSAGSAFMSVLTNVVMLFG